MLDFIRGVRAKLGGAVLPVSAAEGAAQAPTEQYLCKAFKVSSTAALQVCKLWQLVSQDWNNPLQRRLGPKATSSAMQLNLHKAQSAASVSCLGEPAVLQRLSHSQTCCLACTQPVSDTLPCVQDLINALLLSECVYKFVGSDKAHCIQALNDLQRGFPAKLASLHTVQFAQPLVPHRYTASSLTTDSLWSSS